MISPVRGSPALSVFVASCALGGAIACGVARSNASAPPTDAGPGSQDATKSVVDGATAESAAEPDFVFDSSVACADAGADGGCDYATLSTDPYNCGLCGHDCAGGVCQAGACVSGDILATGQHGPIAIAVDAANVYWLNVGTVTGPGGKVPFHYEGGQVMECAIGGCGNSPTILGSGWIQGEAIPPPSGLTVDAVNVYWSGGENLLSCAIAGCGGQPTVRAMSVGGAGVTVAAGGIYLTEYGTSTIALCPLSGCANGPSNFASSVVGPTGITHDDSDVYWVDINGVLGGCPLSGCGDAATSLLTPTAAGSRALVVDDTNLYWTNGSPAGFGSVEQCEKTNCAATAATLASGRSAPLGIAVDATDVYWVEGGSVYKCAIGGCGNSPTTVAATSGPAIALDATHLYVSQNAPSSSDGGDASLDDYVVALPK